MEVRRDESHQKLISSSRIHFLPKFEFKQKYLKAQKNLSVISRLQGFFFFLIPTITIYGFFYESKIRSKIPPLVQLFFLFNLYKLAKYYGVRCQMLMDDYFDKEEE